MLYFHSDANVTCKARLANSGLRLPCEHSLAEHQPEELTGNPCRRLLQGMYREWRERRIQALKAVHKTELIPLPQDFLTVVPD